jgi:hypothetical protein
MGSLRFRCRGRSAGGVDAAVRRGVDGAAQDGFLLEDATSGSG